MHKAQEHKSIKDLTNKKMEKIHRRERRVLATDFGSYCVCPFDQAQGKLLEEFIEAQKVQKMHKNDQKMTKKVLYKHINLENLGLF